MARASFLFAPLFVAGALAAEHVHVIETEHYRLYAEGSRRDAEEMALLLESAWVQFRQFFDATPEVPKGDKLQVRFFLTKERFDEAVKALGGVPQGDVGGCYVRKTKTACLYRLQAPLWTRKALLHEACHQFHFLARTGNRKPLRLWYEEGVAQYVDEHTWDGRNLVLGALPLVSLEDNAAAAAKALESGAVDLAGFVEDRTPMDCSVAWALVRFLVAGNNGKSLANFEAFAKRMDGVRSEGPTFAQAFGHFSEFRVRFVRWLRKEQVPWMVVCGPWEATGRRRLRGGAEGGVSMCLPKRSVIEVAATLKLPHSGSWGGGLLLHFADRNNLTVAQVYPDRTLRIHRKTNGKIVPLAQRNAPPARGGAYQLRATCGLGRVHLWINERLYGPWHLPGARLGLCADRCELSFSDVRWKYARPDREDTPEVGGPLPRLR